MELEAVDSKQCQGEYREGSFMTFGPRKMVRCNSSPTWLAVSIKDGEFYGAMSLCDECKRVCEIQLPETKYQRFT